MIPAQISQKLPKVKHWISIPSQKIYCHFQSQSKISFSTQWILCFPFPDYYYYCNNLGVSGKGYESRTVLTEYGKAWPEFSGGFPTVDTGKRQKIN